MEDFGERRPTRKQFIARKGQDCEPERWSHHSKLYEGEPEISEAKDADSIRKQRLISGE